jgi:hypothetical protein
VLTDLNILQDEIDTQQDAAYKKAYKFVVSIFRPYTRGVAMVAPQKCIVCNAQSSDMC